MGQALSIIIVNWNTRELLRRCLLSLQEAPAASGAQILVVDNGSSDGSGEMVRREFPGVELLASEQNLGFGRANNLALTRAQGSHILLLNPDTEVTSPALESMERYLNDHPDTGVVGTTLRNPDGTVQPSCHPYYSFADSLKHNRLVDRLTDRWQAAAQPGATVTDVDWMHGACLLVRENILRNAGGFDPEFFLYGEEIDLQYRIHAAGWRIVYVPSPGILHHGGQSARQAPLAASLHDYRGRWLFVRRHYSIPSACAYLAKTIFGLVVWTTYWSLRSALAGGPSAAAQRQAYWRLLVWHLADRGLPPAPAAPSWEAAA